MQPTRPLGDLTNLAPPLPAAGTTSKLRPPSSTRGARAEGAWASQAAASSDTNFLQGTSAARASGEGSGAAGAAAAIAAASAASRLRLPGPRYAPRAAEEPPAPALAAPADAAAAAAAMPLAAPAAAAAAAAAAPEIKPWLRSLNLLIKLAAAAVAGDG